MTFSLFEMSWWNGQPIGLFKFARRNLVWCYTTADRPIEHGGDTYEPIAIARGPLREGVERQKNKLTITMPNDAPVASNWRPFPPGDPVTLTSMAMHRGDSEVAVEWVGRIVAAKFTDTRLELTAEPGGSSLRRVGINQGWQRGCPLPLYSQGLGMCNVDKADHALSATLTDVAGLVLTAAAFATAPKPLAGGFIEWARPDGLTDRRSIDVHVGSVIQVNFGAQEFANGLELVVYPGCPHNWDGCESYDNEENYGGAMYMPIKSPFDGSPV